MPTYKSFRYKAETSWTSARRGLLSTVEKPNIVVGSPPEFKGGPDVWTPEELLVGSLNTCIMLTFLALAQARGLTPAAYESEAEGLLENVEGKISHHGGDGSTPCNRQGEGRARACPRDHGKSRGRVLYFEFCQIEDQDHR